MPFRSPTHIYRDKPEFSLVLATIDRHGFPDLARSVGRTASASSAAENLQATRYAMVQASEPRHIPSTDLHPDDFILKITLRVFFHLPEENTRLGRLRGTASPDGLISAGLLPDCPPNNVL